jgi:hypothetical protein
MQEYCNRTAFMQLIIYLILFTTSDTVYIFNYRERSTERSRERSENVLQN